MTDRAGAQSADPVPGMRRQPTQKRSRERVERMLNSAADLIASEGSADLRMSDVAARAGVSIGSLYQYFPDKSALIHALSARYFEQCRRCIVDALTAVETLDGLCTAFDELVSMYWDLFRQEPVLRDIRSGALADRALQDLELADSRANGAELAAALGRVAPGVDPAGFAEPALLLMQYGETTMRLALSVAPDEADRLVAAYRRMATAELRRLVAESGG